MRAHANELILVAAAEIAAGDLTPTQIYDKLYTLVLECSQPPPREVPTDLRHAPLANEVLPRHQRATWARGKTLYDT
jgi:hypothetical protein